MCVGEGSVQGAPRAAWQQAQGRGRQGHFGCPGCGARKMEGGRAAGGSGIRAGPAAGSPLLPRGFCGEEGGEEEPARDGDPGEGLRGLVARRLSARKGENARVGCRDRGAP